MKTVEIYKKGANMFRDKYGFHSHGESETELIRIWTKMERAAHKMCPSSRDHTKLKAAFQQYKDANTNWKDILMAYRADKIKEWNQDSSSRDYTNLQALEKFQQQHQRLPRRRSEDRHEQTLANWLDKAKQRKGRALSIQRTVD